MTALVGPARAKRLAALCEKVDAATALDWGHRPPRPRSLRPHGTIRRLQGRRLVLSRRPPTHLHRRLSTRHPYPLSRRSLSARGLTVCTPPPPVIPEARERSPGPIGRARQRINGSRLCAALRRDDNSG
jgi:hypothetical protein